MDFSGLGAFLVDLDGVVYNDHLLVEGADRMVRLLRQNGYALRFATNTTGRSRGAIARKLRQLGVTAAEDEIFSAPYAAALLLRQTPRVKIRIVTGGDAPEEFQGLTVSDDHPDIIVLGDVGEKFTFSLLNDLFCQILNGASLLALQKNRYWLTGGKLTLDAGPFVAALEYATGKPARVVGKPAADFFRLALQDLDMPAGRVAIIGDDLEADILGAQSAGIRTIFVESGKDRHQDAVRMGIQPDLILPTIAGLEPLLQTR